MSPEDVYAFVDLKSAFHNVLLSEESQKLCCFHFNGEVYCFTVLFFGISNGPFLFNEFLASRVTNPKIKKYIDDLIGTAKSVDELLLMFEDLAETVVKYRIAVAPEKIQIGSRVKALGMIWNKGRLEMDFKKLVSLRYVTMIREKEDLQKNLGVFRFLAKFVPRVAGELEYFFKKCGNEEWS